MIDPISSHKIQLNPLNRYPSASVRIREQKDSITPPSGFIQSLLETIKNFFRACFCLKAKPKQEMTPKELAYALENYKIAPEALSDAQVASLDFSEVSPETLVCLFTAKEGEKDLLKRRVPLLSQTQLGFLRVGGSINFYPHLSKEQICQFDFSKLDKHRLDKILEHELLKENFHSLSNPQVRDMILIPLKADGKVIGKNVIENLLNKLSDPQIQALDVSILGNLDLANYEPPKERFWLFGKEQIQNLIDYKKLLTKHYPLFSNTQWRELDLSKITKLQSSVIYFTLNKTDKVKEVSVLLNQKQLKQAIQEGRFENKWLIN